MINNIISKRGDMYPHSTYYPLLVFRKGSFSSKSIARLHSNCLTFANFKGPLRNHRSQFPLLKSKGSIWERVPVRRSQNFMGSMEPVELSNEAPKLNSIISKSIYADFLSYWLKICGLQLKKGSLDFEKVCSSNHLKNKKSSRFAKKTQ